MISSGVHTCRPSEDPRHQDRCACGHKFASRRDVAYEEKFLVEAARSAERKFGVGGQGWAAAVARRLSLGQARYGDAWLGLDLSLEGVEEGLDGGAYAVLDAQKLLADRHADEAMVSHHIFSAAEHAVAMTFHFQQTRR